MYTWVSSATFFDILKANVFLRSVSSTVEVDDGVTVVAEVAVDVLSFPFAGDFDLLDAMFDSITSRDAGLVPRCPVSSSKKIDFQLCRRRYDAESKV